MAISVDRTLRDLLKRDCCQVPLCNCRRECSFSSETMEQNTGSFRRNRTQPSEHSTCTDKENQSKEKDMGTSVFVNHGKSLDLGDLVPKGFVMLVKS